MNVFVAPKPRRQWCVAARIEAATKGSDIRYGVTNIAVGTAEWLYNTRYCARGQAENLIKLHKSQLASDRTSCRSPTRCASCCTPGPAGSC